MPILSDARALKIVEEIAAKHKLDLPSLVARRGKREYVLARGDLVQKLEDDLGWSQRVSAAFLGWTQPGLCQVMKQYRRWREASCNLRPIGDLKALAALDHNALLRRAHEAEEMNAYLRGELDRLMGVSLAERLDRALDLHGRFRLAIAVAILVEHYPREVRSKHLRQLYEDASDRLMYGNPKDGVSDNLMNKHLSDAAKLFRGREWPTLFDLTPDGRRLSHDFAGFLDERFGLMRASQMAAAGENKRSVNVRSYRASVGAAARVA